MPESRDTRPVASVKERAARPRRVSTHLRGVLVSPAILLRLDQGGCARSSDGPHDQHIIAIATEPAPRRAPERSGPSQPVPAEAWGALATLATQQADQSRQSTEAGAGRRPILARRDEAGLARHSEGRNAAADTPGS